MKSVTLVLAENHTWESTGLEQMLRMIRFVNVVAVVEDYEDLLPTIREKLPRALVLDLLLTEDPNDTRVIQLIPTLKHDWPGMKIIAVTNFGNLVEPARHAGADRADLKSNIADTEGYRHLLARLFRIPDSEVISPVELTAKQAQVLKLGSQGLTDKQIAKATNTTRGNIQKHWQKIYTKLGAQNRPEAIALAKDLRII